ncbi:hypothetical protein SKAU_G00314560 [Synaphobranchus kaupii]|uniref:Uncharacterized protein n=1 Tax=Synaphobranchus kaupii TaxID=118154 RepID=A0A9Q1ILK4_SYNKA|nr:hypothetical protein SKAU_G00314560 [Synaphobranchus kaupii]
MAVPRGCCRLRLAQRQSHFSLSRRWNLCPTKRESQGSERDHGERPQTEQVARGSIRARGQCINAVRRDRRSNAGNAFDGLIERHGTSYADRKR